MSEPVSFENSLSGTQATSALIIASIQKAADAIGATVEIEPDWCCVGQLTYKSGVKRYFRLSTLDLNTMGASEIAKDKGYARFFLEKMGYPVPTGQVVLSSKWAKKLQHAGQGGLSNAWNAAQSIGLPVFVKPNSLSRGTGVAKATTRDEFKRAASEAFKLDKVILVEKAVDGRDYRIVVLDGEVISAYERIPLRIVGDGFSTITELLNKKQREFDDAERGTNIDWNDFRLAANLNRWHCTLESVPELGMSIQLLDNANLSSGGTSVDVTVTVSQAFRHLVRGIARDMGLRLVGVDLIVQGDLSQKPSAVPYWVLEVNSAPGLDHYASMGPQQQQIVDDLYLQVVRAMERPQEAIPQLNSAVLTP